MGLLDGIFQDLTPDLMKVFSDTRVVKLRRTTITSDPFDDVQVPTRTEETVTATPRIEYDESERDGEQIQRGDFKLFVAAKGVTNPPNKRDTTVLVGGVEYGIENVGVIESGDQVAVWELQCRGKAE